MFIAQAIMRDNADTTERMASTRFLFYPHAVAECRLPTLRDDDVVDIINIKCDKNDKAWCSLYESAYSQHILVSLCFYLTWFKGSRLSLGNTMLSFK
jgi:hypothetical protein